MTHELLIRYPYIIFVKIMKAKINLLMNGQLFFFFFFWGGGVD